MTTATETASENADVIQRIDALTNEVKSVVKRADDLEVKIARPNVVRVERKDEPSDEAKAFGTYLRHGKDGLDDIERKTMKLSNDPGAGYLAPTEFSTEFTRDIVEFSPIRAIASVRTTGNASVSYPKRSGVTNARWKGETQAQEGSDPSFGQNEITPREVNTFVDVSNQLLSDSGGSAEAEVRLALAEDFGVKEGRAMVRGQGILEPSGFMTDANVAYTANGHATNLSADALITLMYAIPAAYRTKGTWALNGTTLATIRKLKDGQGNYLWQPSYQAGQPETILGRPVAECIDMDEVASGTFPIAFGDFSQYRIVDRISLSILVNPYLLATQGVTRIHATRRVGGGVMQPKAFRKLKMATS